MSAPRITRILFIVALWLAFTPLRAAQAQRASDLPASPRAAIGKIPTSLSIEPLKPFAIGDQPIVVVHLTTYAHAPIANQPIRVYAYKNRVAQGITDAYGVARIPLHWNFYPGDYELLAAFAGSAVDNLDRSNASARLTLVPGSVRVETVPPLPGAQFQFRGEILTADADGAVTLSMDHIGTYEIQVLPIANQNDKQRISFSRWNDNDVSTYHSFKFPTHRPLQAGFLISYPVTLRYTDKTNQEIDAGRISLTRVRAAGTFYSLSDPTNAWLPTNSILHRVGGFLESKQATYYVDSVMIAGANVVNRGQQRYQVSPTNNWWVQLFIYPATFKARDALFGQPVGSGILLEFPNGTSEQFAFDAGTSGVTVASLPRGIYHGTVQGARGISPRISLSLSRDRSFDLIVITPLDMGIVLGGPALLALIFLIVGRWRPPRWLTARRRTSPAASS